MNEIIFKSIVGAVGSACAIIVSAFQMKSYISDFKDARNSKKH